MVLKLSLAQKNDSLTKALTIYEFISKSKLNLKFPNNNFSTKLSSAIFKMLFLITSTVFIRV